MKLDKLLQIAGIDRGLIKESKFLNLLKENERFFDDGKASDLISKAKPQEKRQLLQILVSRHSKDRLLFWDTDFSGGDYSGLSLTGQKSPSEHGLKWSFDGCDFSNSNFSNSTLTNFLFQTSNFSSCNFTDASLQNTILTALDFTNANLKNTNFQYCSFIPSGIKTLLNNPTFEKEKWGLRKSGDGAVGGEEIMEFYKLNKKGIKPS